MIVSIGHFTLNLKYLKTWIFR